MLLEQRDQTLTFMYKITLDDLTILTDSLFFYYIWSKLFPIVQY